MRDLVVYGLGELGQLYGAAALRAGLRVTPITRASDPQAVLTTLPVETPILAAVGEDALDGVLDQLGTERGQHAILLQNELFPSQWRSRNIAPTVIVAWLLKKRGTALTIARPSPIHGRHTALVESLHAALQIPSEPLRDEAALAQAIVDKYAFILTINALGLLRDRTLSTWLQEDPLRVRALAHEAATLGARLAGADVSVERSVQVVQEGMRALGTMSARGRTAAARVQRAIEQAMRWSLTTPMLREAHEARG